MRSSRTLADDERPGGGLSIPASNAPRVDFPDPDGPDDGDELAGAELEVHPVDGDGRRAPIPQTRVRPRASTSGDAGFESQVTGRGARTEDSVIVSGALDGVSKPCTDRARPGADTQSGRPASSSWG